MLITRKEKEKLVLKLAEEGKTTRDIAKEVHISLKDIGKIIRKATGDSQEERIRRKRKRKRNDKNLYHHMLEPFKCSKIKLLLQMWLLNWILNTDAVLNYHADYLRLLKMDGLVKIYNELKNDFPLFFHLYRRIKKEGIK